LSGIPTIWPIEAHTKAKHVILKRYLSAWFPILSRYSGRIIYLDGFAGPGVYQAGEDGSPVIALQTASEHLLRSSFQEIRFFFIEKDKNRAASLTRVLKNRFPTLPQNIKYQIYGAEFAPTFEQILDTIEKEGSQLAPTFAFIDPFGFSGLPMRLIARLLKCDKCEILVTFMAGFVRRFNDELRENTLNELYDTDEWKGVHDLTDPDERVNFLLGLYERQIKKHAGAAFVKSFGMINRNNQIEYYLVFATKHLKGLEVMKEAMWNVDSRGSYSFSDVTGFNQTYLMDFQKDPQWIQNAAKVIYQRFKGQTISEEDVHRFVIVDTPYIYRKSVLQLLEKSNPPKILNVSCRKRVYSYPEGCAITFGS
jgi:three-Cys-motif partner protein